MNPNISEYRKNNGNNKDFLILFILFYIIVIFPFFHLKYIPFHDLPQQLAAGAAIKAIIFNEELAKNFYIAGFFPNILGWLIIALLNIFFDILTASKLVVFLYFLITPLSIYYYLDDDKKWAVFLSFLFLNNIFLNMGYVNFMFSIPLLFLSLGAFKRNSNFFYPSSFLLFLSHAFTYGIFMIILLFFYAISKVKEHKKILFSMVFFCFIIFSVLGNGSSSELIGILTPTSIITNFVNSVAFEIGGAFQFFRPDYIGFFGFILIMLLYAKQLFWDSLSVNLNYDKTTLCILLFLLILLFFTPLSVPFGVSVWYPNPNRLIPLITFFTITDLRLSRRLMKGLTLLFLFLLIFNSLTLLSAYEKADERIKTQYEPIINALPSGKRIYLLDETNYSIMGFRISKYTYGLSPFEHYITGYYSMKGGFSSEYFGGYYTQWPVKYTDNIYLPTCRRNITKICVLCEEIGEQCYIEATGRRVNLNYSGNETIKCIQCKKRMTLECYEYGQNTTNRFIKDRECIPCERGDINCYLNNSKLKENFDYLVLFGDNMETFMENINHSIYLRTDDVIVYKIKVNSTSA